MAKEAHLPAKGSKTENEVEENSESANASFEPIRVNDEGHVCTPEVTGQKVSGTDCRFATRELVENIAQYTVEADGIDEAGLKKLNGAAAMVAEIGPQDVIEGMLATQMVAVHQALIRHSRKLLINHSFESQRLHESAVNKFARTFAAQIEALRKHRHGGEQVMRVERVTVNDGGQAVVGNVKHDRGHKKDDC